MEKLACIVVLYTPPVNVPENINSYSHHFSKIFVIDNSESPDQELHGKILTNDRVEIHSNNENKGIASAINEGMSRAIREGFTWVLTMDQDSSFREEMITRYISDLEMLPGKDSIAVTGIIHDKSVNPVNEIVEVNGVITSGSFINAAIFNQSTGYDEKLFIDEVDLEYCYRVKTMGYKVVCFTHIGMEHALGKIKTITTLKGTRKQKNFHSPLRLYYIVRNCMYVIRKYKKEFPAEMKFKKKDLLVRIKNNLIYGENRVDSLRKMLKGYADYRKNRFGKYHS